MTNTQNSKPRPPTTNSSVVLYVYCPLQRPNLINKPPAGLNYYALIECFLRGASSTYSCARSVRASPATSTTSKVGEYSSSALKTVYRDASVGDGSLIV